MSCFTGQAVRAAASGRKAAPAARAEGFPLGPWDAGKPSKKKKKTCFLHDEILAVYV